jgi:TonB family protein
VPLQHKTSKVKSLSLVSDDLSSNSISRHPAPPTFGMAAEKERSARKVSRVLLGAVAVALVAAGVYGYSMVNPGFQGLLTSQFANLESMVGLAPKPQPVAQMPRPAAPAKPATPATQPATTSSGVALPTEAAASQQADGFSQPSQTAPSQGFASNAPAQKSAPVILTTSATTAQKSAVESEPPVVADDVADSHVAYRVQPTYPEAARKKGVKGSVVLNASIDKDGNVSGLEVVSGNAQLANAAVAAVKQWRYQVYYHNGQPAEFQTQVTVQFPQPAQH